MNRLHQFDILTAWLGEYLTINNYRPRTVKDYLFEVSFFRRYVENDTDTKDIDEFDAVLLRIYTAKLYDNHNTPGTIHHKLAALRAFFTALYKENKLYVNLTEVLTMPRVGKHLPTNILTESDTAALFEYLEQRTVKEVRSFDGALALRDRALLEVLYSTGIRLSELLQLQLADINYGEGLITIRNGKGGKDRVVPIGKVSLDAVGNYVEHARPQLTSAKTKDELFINRWGKMFSGEGVREIVSRNLKAAGITKRIRVHDMRHTCATHMLNHGADIRYVQELLGHASLSSTQVYTHVSINKLKETHNKYHPRENAEL